MHTLHTERLARTKPTRVERYSAPQSPPASDARRWEAYAPLRATESTVWTADPDLQAAAARVAATWRAEGVREADEGPALLAYLAEAVRQARRGSVVGVEPRAASATGRRLLELLRVELIRAWDDGGAPADTALVLQTWNAVETVRTGLEQNGSEQATSHLAGPNGLELLVEVAHDLRSPLTSILFLAETLQQGQSGAVNELQHRQLGLVYSAALGLSSLASDAIELARSGNELLDDGPSPFSLVALFDSVRDIVHPMAEEKGLTVRVVPHEPDHRLGNPLALGRVLLNLTTNALKFTDQGFVEIHAAPRGPTRLEFGVRDSGRGISPEALGSLYEPFRRNPGRAGYCFSGTGLGLAICRKLVSAMGGELQVETHPEGGTRFYFELELPPAPGL